MNEELQRADTIPLDVENALRERLGSLNFSTRGATSKNQAVSEAGSGSYSVLGPPDGFIQLIVRGKVVYLPYFV